MVEIGIRIVGERDRHKARQDERQAVGERERGEGAGEIDRR